jgi:hypothetical protein
LCIKYIAYKSRHCKVLDLSSQFSECQKKQPFCKKRIHGVCYKDWKLVKGQQSRLYQKLCKKACGWDNFVVYVCNQESVENGVLGGRIRYRHLTAEDMELLTKSENLEPIDNQENFDNFNYWAIPIPDI